MFSKCVWLLWTINHDSCVYFLHACVLLVSLIPDLHELLNLIHCLCSSSLVLVKCSIDYWWNNDDCMILTTDLVSSMTTNQLTTAWYWRLIWLAPWSLTDWQLHDRVLQPQSRLYSNMFCFTSLSSIQSITTWSSSIKYLLKKKCGRGL